ncbi:MAG TPA: NADH-quinone oxidoreductase subunit M [Acidimicrobiia bacterium]
MAAVGTVAAAVTPMFETHRFAAFPPVLLVMILVPVAGAVVTMLLPRTRPEYTRIAGYVASMIVLGMSVFLLLNFNKTLHGYQFADSHAWINFLGVRMSFGIDGISLFMVVLTGLLFPIGLLASAQVENAKAFTAWMLLLEAAMIGVFTARDLLLFFLFFEFVLVPMYFLIAGWGHGNTSYAAMKFFLYTMAGSAFLFVGILTVAYLHAHATGSWSFDIGVLTQWASAKGHLTSTTADLLFLGFAVGFAVKVPLFPLHTWLPDAHTEAPTAGSVVLAGVMLKMGTYGFLRFAIPMFPSAARYFAPLMLTLAVIGIIYGAIVATMQPDLKRLVAYSSVAHLGFVVMGTFALTTQGIQGGLFTMVSHGLTTGALFLLVGMLYDRRHTRRIDDFGGLWKAVPILSGLFLAATFASIGLPGFSGFVGEFTSLLGTFITRRWWAVAATTGVILAAVYLLWAFQRAFTGEPEGENVHVREIGFREAATVVPLLLISLFLGFYPKPLFDRTEVAVHDLMTHISQSTGYHEPVPPSPASVAASEKDTGK